MNWLVIVLAVVVFVISPSAIGRVLAQSHERYPIVACLGDVSHMRTWHGELDTIEWAEIEALEGTPIWVGYENGGWNVPADLHNRPERVYRGMGEDGQPVMIWVTSAPSDPSAEYWFVFDDVTPYAINGAHYGVHPCGAYRVEREG